MSQIPFLIIKKFWLKGKEIQKKHATENGSNVRRFRRDMRTFGTTPMILIYKHTTHEQIKEDYIDGV